MKILKAIYTIFFLCLMFELALFIEKKKKLGGKL